MMISAKILMVFILTLFAIIIALIMSTIWLLITWKEERQDLYNRIMAGSLTDYKDGIREKPPPKGGNGFRAAMNKAAEQQFDALKAGDG